MCHLATSTYLACRSCSAAPGGSTLNLPHIVDVLCHPGWNITPQPSWWRLLLAVLVLLMCSACATLTGRKPEAEQPPPPPPLPEVRQITFTGNTHFSDRTLRAVMATQPRSWLTPWKKGEPYNLPTVEADLLRIRKYYFDRGFLNTTVQLDDVQEDPEKQAVRLTIAIDEGPPTLVREVRLAGSIPPELPSERDLLAALPLRPHERLNKADFDESQRILLTRLQNASYARAEIVPQTEVDSETHTATVTFELRPGELTSFGQVTIAGAQRVKEEAIRRQLTIEPGELYRREEVVLSTDAIYGLGMFQAVTPRILNPEEQGAPLDVEFDVRERQPRSVAFGIGLSTVELFRVQAEWTHRNLWQEANRLTFAARISSIRQEASARFEMPYFFAPRTTLAQTVFGRNEQDVTTGRVGGAFFGVEESQPAFDLFSVGSETRVGHQFTRAIRGFVGVELSRNDFSNVDPAAILAAGEGIAEDNFLFIQFTEWERNTSDSLLNPTRGTLVRGRLDHSNTSLLSDVSFLKGTLEGRHYLPLWANMVLATRVKVGTVEPYGDSDVIPFNVRFFAGGPGSVRGFALNRLGPKDAEGDPIGGNSLLEASVELRFPITGDLGGAVFFDAGNVYRDSFSFRIGDLRYAAGPGIRYNTPIGPLRLDVGFVLNRRAGEDFGRVEFSIGQAF
jgi:outer membrane protein assembly complex protein YaeT